MFWLARDWPKSIGGGGRGEWGLEPCVRGGLCNFQLPPVKHNQLELLHPRRPRGSQSGREKRRDESFQVRAKEPLGTDFHRAVPKNSSGCQLLIGHKKCFVLLCPIDRRTVSPKFLSWVRTRRLLFQSRLVWLMHQRNASSQETFSLIWNPHLISKYCLPENWRRFPKTTSLSLQQVFKLASVTSCVNIKEFWKDTTTADNHENVAWKREFNFFFSFYHDYSNSLTLSNPSELFWGWISINISKSMKIINFVIACLRPSQNMKLGISTGSCAVDGKEMYKKVRCTCKVVVLPCQAIAYLTLPRTQTSLYW